MRLWYDFFRYPCLFLDRIFFISLGGFARGLGWESSYILRLAIGHCDERYRNSDMHIIFAYVISCEEGFRMNLEERTKKLFYSLPYHPHPGAEWTETYKLLEQALWEVRNEALEEAAQISACTDGTHERCNFHIAERIRELKETK